MRAAAYVRVSTRKQAEKEVSLEDQVEQCTHLARQLGAEEVMVFSDPGRSGADADRPGLRALLEAVGQGQVGLVVCYDVDRWARDLADQLVFAEEVERLGARLEFVTTRKGSTPEDNLFFQMKGAFAEYERAKIRHRCLTGKRRKAFSKQRIVNCARAPYGYIYNKDPEDPRLEIDPERAAVVRRIFDWITTERLGVAAVAERLRALGIPSPRGKRYWFDTTVRGIVRNPVYRGHFYQFRISAQKEGGKPRRHLRPLEEAACVPVPPIVSEQQWERAQRLLAGNGTGGQGAGSRGYAAEGSHGEGVEAEHPCLGGLVYCGECGGRFILTSGDGGRHYYRCRRHWRPGPHPRCGNAASIRASAPGGWGLDDLVWARVEQILTGAEALHEGYRFLLQETRAARTREVEGELRRGHALLVGITRQKEELLDLHLEGLLSGEELRARFRALEERRRQLAAEAASLRVRLGRREGLSRLSLDLFARQVAAGLHALTAGGRREVLRLLGPRVVVFPDRRVEVELAIPWVLPGQPVL